LAAFKRALGLERVTVEQDDECALH
jgi:hypothetical protein